jgi:hypothetical protein
MNKRRQDLMEMEHFINRLLDDVSHPIYNRSHPLHFEYVNALHDLMEKADAIRSRLSSESTAQAA